MSLIVTTNVVFSNVLSQQRQNRKLLTFPLMNYAVYCLIALLCFCSCFTQRSPAEHTLPVSFHNPVLNVDFPDPTIINVNGTYYAYATQGSYQGKMSNIQLATSNDLIHWTYIGDALPRKPEWASHTQDFWAPHVLYDSSLQVFVMFYSAKSNDTTTDKCMGVAFSSSPAGPFLDKGAPLLRGKGFEDIDPMAIIDTVSGKKLLYWGSGFQPIRVQEMSSDWDNFLPGSSSHPLVYPGKEKDYTNLIEGSWVDYQNGNYYLYYSGDNCCGDKANYAVMVARADNPFGPFRRLGEANGTGSSVILQKDSVWLAPGHNSIVKDKLGNKWIAYHAIWRDKRKQGKPVGKDHYVKRVFCIAPLQYIDGWPVVKPRD